MTADRDGLFIVTAKVPAGASLGQHEMESTCVDGAGQALVQESSITVVPEPGPLPPKTLP